MHEKEVKAPDQLFHEVGVYRESKDFSELFSFIILLLLFAVIVLFVPKVQTAGFFYLLFFVIFLIFIHLNLRGKIPALHGPLHDWFSEWHIL